MNNGCDLNCGTLFAYLKEAVEKGMVKEERLNEALVHLFTTRMMLGVFDQKGENPYDQISYEVVDSEADAGVESQGFRKVHHAFKEREPYASVR